MRCEAFETGRADDEVLDPGWTVVREGDNTVISGEGHPGHAGENRLRFRLKLECGTIHLSFGLCLTNEEGGQWMPIER